MSLANAVRDYTRELLAQGVNPVDSMSRLQERFGADKSPTIYTVYKWRKEFRGGKGERQAQVKVKEEPDDNCSRPSKIFKKDLEKYCTPCNREMSGRYYYELHALKVSICLGMNLNKITSLFVTFLTHDVFLGETTATLDYLEGLDPSHKKRIIYRCDSCPGGNIDYSTLQELRKHLSSEHAQIYGIAIETGAGYSVPSSKATSTSPTKAMRNLSSPEKNKKWQTMAMGLRRSTRIHRPSSAMLQSILTTKELSEIDDAEMQPENLADTSGTNESIEEEAGAKIVKVEHQEEQEEDNEDEPFVTFLRDGRIEVEEPEFTQSRNTKSRQRMLSPDALDAAKSMLKLALNSAAVTEEKDQPKECSSSTAVAAVTAIGGPSSAVHKPASRKKSNKRLKRSHKKSTASTQNGDARPKMFYQGLDGPIRVMKKRVRMPTRRTVLNQLQREFDAREAEQAKQQEQKLNERHVAPTDNRTVEPKNTQNGQINANQDANVSERTNSGRCTPGGQHSASAIGSTTVPLLTLDVPQDDCTWFAHSVAASLRQMDHRAKELAKMRIQQVLYECVLTSGGGSTSASTPNDHEKHSESGHSQKSDDGVLAATENGTSAEQSNGTIEMSTAQNGN